MLRVSSLFDCSFRNKAVQRGFPTVLLISKNRLVTKIGATISEGHKYRGVAQPNYRFDLRFHRFHCNIPSMVVFQINSADFVTDSIKATDVRISTRDER